MDTLWRKWNSAVEIKGKSRKHWSFVGSSQKPPPSSGIKLSCSSSLRITWWECLRSLLILKEFRAHHPQYATSACWLFWTKGTWEIAGTAGVLWLFLKAGDITLMFKTPFCIRSKNTLIFKHELLGLWEFYTNRPCSVILIFFYPPRWVKHNSTIALLCSTW